jgi:hypothetical protein
MAVVLSIVSSVMREPRIVRNEGGEEEDGMKEKAERRRVQERMELRGLEWSTRETWLMK